MRNPPAFPTQWTNDGDQNNTAPNGEVVPPFGSTQLHGMTLRDYFAAKALAGWIASTEPQRNPVEVAHSIALGCYAIADAMLRARGSSHE